MASVEDLPYHHSYICIKTEMKVHETIRPSMSARPSCSIVFCNSVSADRIVMAVSRLLRAVAALVILLSFAARLRKSYWGGCMKAATVICQQVFSILALVFFCCT